MKITIVHGNERQGSTWHVANTVIHALSKEEKTQVTSFSLPKDMPHFCTGCFSCFMRGENKCPHAASVEPIVTALLDADLVVLTSPVYVYDVSGQMKALLDHLGYMWLPHRPAPAMFGKTGLTVVTTAGAGVRRTTATLRKSLMFWGVRRIYSLGGAVAANGWANVPEKRKAKIERKAKKSAARIARTIRRGNQLPYPFFRAILFKVFAGMHKKNLWGALDHAHWKKNGWLDGKKPF